jgi:anti-anti-sigma factor
LEIVNISDNIVLFVIKEDIMSYMVDRIKEEIYNTINEKRSKVILDLNNIEYIDSLGIGAIIELFKKTKSLNGNIVMINVSQPVMRLIKMLNVQKFLRIGKNLNEAVEILSA